MNKSKEEILEEKKLFIKDEKRRLFRIKEDLFVRIDKLKEDVDNVDRDLAELKLEEMKEWQNYKHYLLVA